MTHPDLSLPLQCETVDGPHFGEHWTVGKSEAYTEDPGPHLQIQPVKINIHSRISGHGHITHFKYGFW